VLRDCLSRAMQVLPHIELFRGLASEALAWVVVIRASLWLWLQFEQTRTAVEVERRSRPTLKGTSRSHESDVEASAKVAVTSRPVRPPAGVRSL
jgi:hypothetical protein